MTRFETCYLLPLAVLLATQLALPAAYGLGSVERRFADYQGYSYQSPYKIRLDADLDAISACDREPPRNDWRLESRTPFEDWYGRRVLRELGSWGPEPRHYAPPAYIDRMTADQQRQRVIAVAESMIGLPYQHHHIPDFDPPADWPWHQVGFGRNSKGLDCSNFTGWIYNYGLGIRLNTNVHKQAELDQADRGHGISTPIQTLSGFSGYDDIRKRLLPGDLLYIRNNKGDISHVVMWLGKYGDTPASQGSAANDNMPLIIDCTGEGRKDANGADIPLGVQIRAFSKNSWYYKSFSHAKRIIQ